MCIRDSIITIQKFSGFPSSRDYEENGFYIWETYESPCFRPSLCLSVSLCVSLCACVDQNALAFEDVALDVRGAIYRTETDKGARALLASLASERSCNEISNQDIEDYLTCIEAALPHIERPSLTD